MNFVKLTLAGSDEPVFINLAVVARIVPDYEDTDSNLAGTGMFAPEGYLICIVNEKARQIPGLPDPIRIG